MLQGGVATLTADIAQGGKALLTGSGRSSEDLERVSGGLWQITHIYLDSDFHLVS